MSVRVRVFAWLILAVGVVNLAQYIRTGNVVDLVLAILAVACFAAFYAGRWSRRQATRGRTR